MLRQRASDLLVQANDTQAAVVDLNPLLVDFNDRQMRGPDRGAGG